MKDSTYIGIEEANKILGHIRQERGLISHGNSWRYWLKRRDKTKNTIEIAGLKVSFFVIGRKICVNKKDFLNKAITYANKEKESIIKRENGPIEGRGMVNGAFVEIPYIDSGMNASYYVCRKCEHPAETKHEKEECHTCRDWNGCGRNCTLSHLICKNCNIVQDV